MSWHDWLVDEMIPGADEELAEREASIVSVTSAKTHWEHWQAIYVGIQGAGKVNLEAQLLAKKVSLYNSYSAWESTHSYVPGNVVKPGNGYVYECTSGGTSGGAEPTWDTTVGNAVNDPDEFGVIWKCGIVEIQYGVAYNVTNMSDWDIKRRITIVATEGTVLYHYLTTGWDGNTIIIKAINDWGIMYTLLTNSVFGADAMVSNLGNALTIMTNWKNAIESRNPILGDYV